MEELPGFVALEWREFRYVQVAEAAASSRGWFHDLLDVAETLPLPAEGGCVEERVLVRTPDGLVFAGLSYRGDIEGWRRYVEAIARHRHCVIALIEGNELACSDGRRYRLADCIRWFA
ncbi:hypothetical protein [Microbacterium sp. BH-3-3-3]|uniref:hypothetical protein n=1 Tax=Microbacterium sp. BH-3-3-3 TaxID=1906742 RepID=UPI0012E9E15A|nr:hypothetical protein [Microbacterium sp. BH-3-3-3]